MFRSTPEIVIALFLVTAFLTNTCFATPAPTPFPYQSSSLVRRVYPTFPDSPPSCPICAQNYDQINSCAQAAPVLANVTMVLFNPGAFIDVIKCACTDTFQSVFPQCVDCFVQTNQTDVLNTPNLPGLVSNIRSICAFMSTVLSNKTSSSSAIVTATATQPLPSNGAGTMEYMRAAVIAGGFFFFGTLSTFL